MYQHPPLNRISLDRNHIVLSFSFYIFSAHRKSVPLGLHFVKKHYKQIVSAGLSQVALSVGMGGGYGARHYCKGGILATPQSYFIIPF